MATSICKIVRDTKSRSTVFTFRGHQPIAVAADQFDDGIKLQLLLAGIQHILRDSYAGADGSVEKARQMFFDKLASLIAGFVIR